MAKGDREIKRPNLGEKDCWNLYSLQVLSPAKFVKVVGKVLNGRYVLIAPKTGKTASQ